MAVGLLRVWLRAVLDTGRRALYAQITQFTLTLCCNPHLSWLMRDTTVCLVSLLLGLGCSHSSPSDSLAGRVLC